MNLYSKHHPASEPGGIWIITQGYGLRYFTSIPMLL